MPASAKSDSQHPQIPTEATGASDGFGNLCVDVRVLAWYILAPSQICALVLGEGVIKEHPYITWERQA